MVAKNWNAKAVVFIKLFCRDVIKNLVILKIAWLIKHLDHILSPTGACLPRQDSIANLKQELVWWKNRQNNRHYLVFFESFLKNATTLLCHIIVLFSKHFGQNVPFKISIKSTNQSIKNSKQRVLRR